MKRLLLALLLVALAGPSLADTLKISAKELHAFYEANEIKADSMLKDKWFFVHGQVAEVDQFMGAPVVYLYVDDMTVHNVRCMFEKSARAQVADLVKGQLITVKGTCHGMTLTAVTMVDCELQ